MQEQKDYKIKCTWGKLFMRYYNGEISSETLQKLTASNQMNLDFEGLVVIKGEKWTSKKC